MLEGLQSTRNEQQVSDIKQALLILKRKSTNTLQWIPAHFGITGNEKADALSKAGSKKEQTSHKVTYREAKTIIHNQYNTRWKRRLGVETGADCFHQLQRHQQTILF